VEALERDLTDSREPAPVPVPVAPDFSLSDLDGRTVTQGELRTSGRPLLLVFTEPECASCRALLPNVAAWQRDLGDRLTVVPISRGATAANRERASAAGLRMLLVQDDREVETAYGVDAMPSAVGITPTGFLASPMVAGTDAIRDLMEHVIAALQSQAGSVPGNGNGHGMTHGHSHGGRAATDRIAQ